MSTKTQSERSDQRYKPKLPRLRRLFQRRSVERELDWIPVVDQDYLITIKSTKEKANVT